MSDFLKIGYPEDHQSNIFQSRQFRKTSRFTFAEGLNHLKLYNESIGHVYIFKGSPEGKSLQHVLANSSEDFIDGYCFKLAIKHSSPEKVVEFFEATSAVSARRQKEAIRAGLKTLLGI